MQETLQQWIIKTHRCSLYSVHTLPTLTLLVMARDWESGAELLQWAKNCLYSTDDWCFWYNSTRGVALTHTKLNLIYPTNYIPEFVTIYSNLKIQWLLCVTYFNVKILQFLSYTAHLGFVWFSKQGMIFFFQSLYRKNSRTTLNNNSCKWPTWCTIVLFYNTFIESSKCFQQRRARHQEVKLY